MPPKASKSSSKQKGQEEQREDALQAVVLTDPYEKGFSPFTLEKPRCLLPVANVPLIEYTLEFLAHTGIKDVFLYVGAHQHQVEDYVNHSRWKSSTSPFSNFTILRCPATSVGDAMRDLDKRDLIKGDFVLVLGDLISNFNLDIALLNHRARREKDKNAIMTMVLREAGRDNRSKPSTRDTFFFIDPRQDRCLHYEEKSKSAPGDGRFHLEADLLAKPEIDIRGDLVDCNIDICTPEVLSLWTDNVEYTSIRSSFLRGILQDYELNGKTIHTHLVEEGYAARVSNLRAYNAVTKDIVGRWTYPFTPDCNLIRGHKYRLLKTKVYLEAGVVLARGSAVKARSILGKDTSVGDGSIISDSVLGRRCQIGKNVTIHNSYIWDDVVVGDNSTITSAIIGDEAVLGRDCSIQPGTLLSFRVRLSNNTTPEKSTRLTHARHPSQPDASPPSDATLVGPYGAGAAYSPASSDAESTFFAPSLQRRTSSSSLASISTLASAPSSPIFPARRDSQTSLPSSTSATVSTVRPTGATATFLIEATTSIQDGILKGDAPDTVRLELLSQRFSYDASDASTRNAIARALVMGVFGLMKPPLPQSPSASGSGQIILSSSPGTGGALGGGEGLQAKEATTRVMGTYGPILLRLGLFDADKKEKTDQVAVLREIEAECEARLLDGSGPGDKVLLFTLDSLHRELELLEDDGVLQWWNAEGEEGGNEGGVKDVRKLVQSYIDLVLQAESESESDDESEEDEEEDEEDE